MANENEDLAKLAAARSRMVTERRELASALAEKYKRGHTDDMREQLVQIQATIEALDRAIGMRPTLPARKLSKRRGL